MFHTRRLRWYIGGLLFLSTVVNYMDRQTLSVLAPILKQEYSWTNTDFAMIIIAFRVAYSMGQLGWGPFLDRVGTRLGLSLTVSRSSRPLRAACDRSPRSGSCWAWAKRPTGRARPKRCPSGSHAAKADGQSP